MPEPLPSLLADADPASDGRALQAMLQQERLRALGQMASGVAHDINNAISPISLYVHLLRREPQLSEEARQYLASIDRAVDSIAHTVSRLRQFYRPRDAQSELGTVDLNQLIGEVIDLTRTRWRDLPQERGVMIELVQELSTPLAPIMGVESELRDALTNLIFNAVDAMPKGGRLSVRTKILQRAESGNRVATCVCLEVADTGIGMDEETRRRCLEPFFTTKGERGTGLGLAMVYGMAERHGAELSITSAHNVGTTMQLTFHAARTAAEHTPASPDHRAVQGCRILIVDDDPLILESLRSVLDGEGHHVVTADGGNAGIDAFAAACASGEPFAIVITDLGMPHVDGRVVAEAVKTASPATPVILLTGWGRQMGDGAPTPAHVDRLLGKPPRLHELRAALADLMGPANALSMAR